MDYLKGKKIILAVTGSIAAYKTPHLVRLLVKSGVEVKVLITEAAATLVSPLALSTVSKNTVLQSISDQSDWNNHVELGYWADAMLIAPLSANTMAALANGTCHNIIHAVYLSARCPVILAPAMDEDMWHHPSVRSNLQRLKNYERHFVIDVAHGELASGLIGEGRMAEPEEIHAYLNNFFAQKQLSKRGKALVTAGPTYEKLDPVRYIGNFSSGKMGVAIADALILEGYEVELICGPGVKAIEKEGLTITPVVSAQEMYDACVTSFPNCDLAIMAAAVADFRPKQYADQKIKKKSEEEEMSIALVKNPDILAELGKRKKEHQKVVGFALETENALENGRKKLEKKNADFIAVNHLSYENPVFGSDYNEITLISAQEQVIELPAGDKTSLAHKLVQLVTVDK